MLYINNNFFVRTTITCLGYADNALQVAKSIGSKVNTVVWNMFSRMRVGSLVSSVMSKIAFQDDIEEIDTALVTAKNREDYFEVLVKRVPFLPLKCNDTIAASSLFHMTEYRVHTILEDIYGMRAIFLVPEMKGEESPLVLFRGTDPMNFRNILDDLGDNPGDLNFSRKKEAIGSVLEKIAVSEEYGAFHVLGYSFGGALAQKTTAAFPEYVVRCTSHNGLRAGKKTAQLFREKMRDYPPSYPRPEIWEYRHGRDFVPQLGEESLPTTPGKLFVYGATDTKVNFLRAHNMLAVRHYDAPEECHRLSKHVSSCALEVIRKQVGNVAIPVYKHTTQVGVFLLNLRRVVRKID